MRIFDLRKNYEKISIVLIFGFFITADANFQLEKAKSNSIETTTASLYTTAGWNPWEATTTSVAITTMTPTRPSDGVNLCTVDAHCHNGGKCGDYCPYIEGLGNCFKLYSLVRFNRDLLRNHIKGVWCPYERICYCAPGWYGIECKNTKPLCNESYCAINGGTCNDLDFLQMSGCDCTGTGYHGAMCEFKDCSD